MWYKVIVNKVEDNGYYDFNGFIERLESFGGKVSTKDINKLKGFRRGQGADLKIGRNEISFIVLDDIDIQLNAIYNFNEGVVYGARTDNGLYVPVICTKRTAQFVYFNLNTVGEFRVKVRKINNMEFAELHKYNLVSVSARNIFK